MQRGQGTFEYLIILAAILAASVVVVLIANTLLGTPQEANIVNQDKYNFAVNGWELRGYNKPFDAMTPATVPQKLIKDMYEYSYVSAAPPIGAIAIGSLTGSDGESYIVYVDDDNFYINTGQPAECGDSVVQEGEECDDGNTVDGDGCSATCTIEVPPEPTCTDSIKNQDESDVDCGGSCPACPESYSCVVDSDCTSLICSNGKCALARWGALEKISREGADTIGEDVTLAAEDGKLYVAWLGYPTVRPSSGSGTFFRYWDGSSWSEIFPLSTEGWGGSAGNADIAVEGGNAYIVWSDNTQDMDWGSDNDIFIKSWDGSSLSALEMISTENSADSYWPSVAVENGKIYVTWADQTNYNGAGTEFDVFFKHWNGTQWTGFVNSTDIVSTESTGHSFKPSIAVENGEIYIAWADETDYNGAGTDQDIFFKYWDGASWSQAEVVSAGGGEQAWPSLVVENGKFYITWMKSGTYPVDIYFSYNDGIGWNTPEIVSNEPASIMKTAIYPSLAVDAGIAYIIWMDSGSGYAGSGGDIDIFLKKWDGSSWTNADVLTNTTEDDAFPDIAAGGGNIYAAWQEPAMLGGEFAPSIYVKHN